MTNSDEIQVGIDHFFDEYESWPFDTRVFVKCQYDYFDYSLRLTTGEVIRFTEATKLPGGWLHLREARILTDVNDEHSPEFDRGIDVRIEHIVWMKDAPFGS